jgi:hypothetical protein
MRKFFLALVTHFLIKYFSELKRTLDLWKDGFYKPINWDDKHFFTFYKAIRDALHQRAKTDREWTRRFLINTARA